MDQEPRQYDRHEPEEEIAGEEAYRVDRDEVGDDAFEPISEGSGEQYGTSSEEPYGERVPESEGSGEQYGTSSEEPYGERVPEGSGKQFARGVGDDLTEEEGRERREP